MGWLVIAGILWLLVLWGLVRIFRSKGPLTLVQRLAGTLLTALVAVVLSSVLLIQHLFYVFAHEEVVAQVMVRKLAPTAFELTYQPLSGAPVVAQLDGDQWAISGGLMTWKPWMMMLGAQSYHRPLRLSGQYSRLEEQRQHLPTISPLVPEGLDQLWEALYWLQPYLPFVEAAYGSSAYVYAEPGATFNVYVSPTGYLIKRAKQ